MDRFSFSPFLSVLFMTTLFVASANGAEIRGEIAEVVDGATFVWTSDNFPGFYYDSATTTGTESLSMTIEGRALQEDIGAIYKTNAQAVSFSFEDFGRYYVIGFMGMGRFAGYVDGIPFRESDSENLLSQGALSIVLFDSDRKLDLGSGTTLKLNQGYELAVSSIDLGGNKVFVHLYKNGVRVDSGIVSPSDQTTPESTYLYKTNLVGGGDIVIMAVHFSKAIGGVESDLVTIDGVWQIADQTLTVREGDEYDKMTVQEVDPESVSITLTNEDESISLSRDKDFALMDGIRIRTADQRDVSPENPLRFYIYRVV